MHGDPGDLPRRYVSRVCNLSYRMDFPLNMGSQDAPGGGVFLSPLCLHLSLLATEGTRTLFGVWNRDIDLSVLVNSLINKIIIIRL